ncbi:amino acid/amide ABC transporter substrate-binding protein, HAAT family [Rhizobiales bacterium GAS113]|nr:amino acid/amide ABC transporter substrate-binding protein, HAAT family [Rhizobiales bacterium GAS113]
MSGPGNRRVMTNPMNETLDPETSRQGKQTLGGRSPQLGRRLAMASALALVVGACSGAGFPGFEQTPVVPATPGNAGGVKIALILPLTAGGQTAIVANSLKNAGELALAEANSPNVQLIVKDDRGTADGASAAAQEALTEGAELIVGPLLAANVQAAAAVARPAGRSMIAFSSDASVATRGVYLLSFMPATDVQRVVSFAASQGKRSFAALVPDTAYGQVTSGAFQETVSHAGGRVVALEHYGADHNQMIETVKRLAPALQQADALFIPDAADTLPGILEALTGNGVDLKRVKLIGTGQWNDPKLFRLPQMQGAWFPAPETAGFNAFAQRYRAKFSSEPTRTATLSYDALSLAAALVRTQGSQRFSESVLTNPSGFAGADGLFRFRADGSSERGLAVLEMRNGSTAVVSGAPKSFSGS